MIATRYIIQAKNITDANVEKEMLIALREIADTFPFPVTIYHHYFIFFDQFVLVRSISIQTITVAAIVMMFISMVFIPSPSCAIWVAFSILSIEIGVIGYMTLWNVNLDSISMINLIMCIGFSVDFSAHISYAYISCDERTSDAKVKSALYSLGLPIFQGSVSTVLGIIALAFAPSYVFVTFFKTVFLVMLFGATHGVLLLPVLLSLTDFTCMQSKVPPDAMSENNSLHTSKSQRARLHYKATNLTVANKDSPFFTTDKYFTGKSIVHKPSGSGGPIFIPRPSYIGLDSEGHAKLTTDHHRGKVVDELSVEGSKSSTDGSLVAEKDLGLGTSAEECSESSWKGEKSEEIVKKQPQSAAGKMGSKWNTGGQHINDGYVSDGAEGQEGQRGHFDKAFVCRSKSSDIAESRRHRKHGGTKQTSHQFGPQRTSQARLSGYSQQQQYSRPPPGALSNPAKWNARRNSSSQHNKGGSFGLPPANAGIRYLEPDVLFHKGRHPKQPPNAELGQFHYFDYNAHWDNRWTEPETAAHLRQNQNFR